MKRIIFLVAIMVFALFAAVNSYAEDLTKAKAEKMISDGLKAGGLPVEWGESYLGSVVKKLDYVKVTRVVPKKSETQQCEKSWIVVVSVKGVGRTNNGPVIANHDFKFEKTGTFMMCVGYDGQWYMSLQS